MFNSACAVALTVFPLGKPWRLLDAILVQDPSAFGVFYNKMKTRNFSLALLAQSPVCFVAFQSSVRREVVAPTFLRLSFES